ncbi:IS1595 family transposase [Maribacter sp. 2-571]|uniref:IS1595 family transposase n=1 Tax=Maribacter sp. 2-571 TaxID=3417569 RepID=UPI003D34690E
MELRFKSLSLFEFQERYPDGDSRLSHLADFKWADGFNCRRCGHGRSCKGGMPRSRQCTSCRYDESLTAGTLFHKVKFDILKAFYIVYFVSTNKKGITSTELSRKFDLGQKTCWAFKRKVIKAMKSSGNYPITGTAEVDETVFGGQEEGIRGRKNGTKKLVVVGIEKKKKGVYRLYAWEIPKADAASLGGFKKGHIATGAKVTTDQWTGYGPLAKTFENLAGIPSGRKRSNFPELHRAVMNLKGWLRGIHHHIGYLQDDLDEYCYRFNRSFMKEGMFDNLVKRMVHPRHVISRTLMLKRLSQ